MADTKVSEKTAATAAAEADQLYLVQNGIGKKITVANLFGTVAGEVRFAKKIKFDESIITNTGTIQVTKSVVNLRLLSAPHALTLPAGEAGQLLVIYVSNYSTTDSFVQITGTFVGHSALRFTALGQSAILLSNGTGWIVLNTTGTTT